MQASKLPGITAAVARQLGAMSKASYRPSWSKTAWSGALESLINPP
jgi:hypothetical protein